MIYSILINTKKPWNIVPWLLLLCGVTLKRINEMLELNAGGLFWLKNMKYIHSLVKKHEVHPFDEMFHP